MPTYELFVILSPLKQAFAEFVLAVEHLDLEPAPLLAQGHHSGEADVALLGLQFDERLLGAAELDRVRAAASRSGLPLIDPATMTREARRNFYRALIREYPLRTEELSDPASAVIELGRLLGLLTRQISPSLASIARSPSPGLELAEPTRAGATPRVEPTPPPRLPTAPVARQAPRPPTITEVDTPVAPPHHAIALRYRRGDRDEALRGARLCRLSLRGAFVATHDLPFLGDPVELVLEMDGAETRVRGVVEQLIAPHACPERGYTGFEVRFPAVRSPQRRRLAALLVRARDAGVVLGPPPRRRAARFAADLPITIVTDTDDVSATTADVSSGGMFIETAYAVPDSEFAFILYPTDEAPVAGCARIVREVSEVAAERSGRRCGYGVEIVCFGEGSQRSYARLLDQLACRRPAAVTTR